MPILPLDHPEPFAATLGVMLYPGVDNGDPGRARAFAAQWLAVPLRHFHDAGHRLSYDILAELIQDAGAQLSDLKDRWRGGHETGDLFKALFCLAKNHPPLASWENAIGIYLRGSVRTKRRGSRSALLKELSRFRNVAHLWGAWSIRDFRDFAGAPERDYDGADDFQCFLVEAEILRDFGQTWRSFRKNSAPPLPSDAWSVPMDWTPPVRGPNWPNTGMIPDIALPAELIADLKPAGRPGTVR
jgi:hypothetical protein